MTGIVWKAPPRWARATLVTMLSSALRDRVVEAYLIGSHARGDAHLDSDVDLLVVAATDLPWPERGQLFADLRQKLGAHRGNQG